LAAGAGTYGIGVSSTAAGVQTTGVLAMSGAGNSLATNTVAFTVAPASAPLTLGVHSLTNVFTSGAGAFTLPGATVTSNSALYNFALVTGTVATNVDVSVTSNLANVAANGNNSAAGTTLLGVNTNLAANVARDALLPAAQQGQLLFAQGQLVSATAGTVNGVMTSVQPTVDGSSAVTALGVGTQVQAIDDTRLASIRGGDALSGVAAGASANGWNMWVQGLYNHGQQDMKDLIAGYKADTWGGAIGVDSSNMISNGVLGVSFNYGRTTAESSNFNTTDTTVDNYGFNLYGGYDLGQQYFTNGQLGYAYNKITDDRHNVGGLGGLTAHGDTNSDQYMAKLAVGRDFGMDRGLTLTPTVSAAYTHLHTKGFTETGAGGADLVVGASNLNDLKLGVGLNAGWNFKNADGSNLKPAVHVGYAYDALNDRVDVSSTFAGDTTGTAFTTEGARPDRSSFNAGAGVVYATTANWDLSANYDYTYKSHYDSHTGILRATSHF
jgi:outer membrane autotransporter protein